jgi:hypothetical protein
MPSFSEVMLKAYPALAPVLFPVPREELDTQSFATGSSLTFAREDSEDEYEFMVGGLGAWVECRLPAFGQYSVDDQDVEPPGASSSSVVCALGSTRWKTG